MGPRVPEGGHAPRSSPSSSAPAQQRDCCRGGVRAWCSRAAPKAFTRVEAESPFKPPGGKAGLRQVPVWHSAGGRGDGFLQVLAHELPGTRHLDVVITGVTDEDGVVQLLIGDGQLQVAATGTEHVPTVPVKERENR